MFIVFSRSKIHKICINNAFKKAKMNIFAKIYKIFILYLNKKYLCCTIRIVKELLATITKDGFQNNVERLAIINAVRNDGGFELYEIGIDGEIRDNTSLALVFGGDGTTLETVRICAPKGVPVLGVNLGNLGFLTSCEKTISPKDLISAIKNKQVFRRSLLDVHTPIGQFVALNEVTLKGKNSRPIYVDLYVDTAFVDCYHGDGTIISTPTGSTAYSLSAGGPILAPDVNALLVNPICAHSLHSRPIVVSDVSLVSLQLRGENDADVFVDGKCVATIKSGEKITAKKSQNTAQFVTVNGGDFYKKLLDKMNSWGTTYQN